MMTRKTRPDVVLVNPGGRTRIYQSLGSTLTAIEPPVWAGLIATYVRNRGCSVEIIDSEAEELSPEATADRIGDLNPLLTAVVVYGHQPSASTQNMPGAGAICAAVKHAHPELKTLLVGGHVAALPERTLQEEDVDFVCGGEGPVTVFELVQAVKAGESDYGKVHDLVYRDGDQIITTMPAPLVHDLAHDMPGLAWDLLPMDRYRAHNWHSFGHLQRQPYASLYTTLGCPYRCTFCCIQAPFKSGEQVLGLKETTNSYRFWTPEAIVAQIDLLVSRYGVRTIKIADEMFVLNMKHVHGICDLLIARNYDLNIWAYARVDTVRGEGTVEKLKRAGFQWLAFGIESANERVRKDVDKGFKQDDIFKTLTKVRAAGINVIANYIFGLPEDDVESMQETLDMALELNCEFGNFYCAMAYPGSQLYNVALKEGWALPERWSGYSQHSVDSLPLPTKHLPASEVLRFRDHAFDAYFASPRYLDMIRGKFGDATVDHIREMASYKLTRTHAPESA
ncbi:MAG: B12-binding domain-containing radical SAM protein [bacterium]